MSFDLTRRDVLRAAGATAAVALTAGCDLLSTQPKSGGGGSGSSGPKPKEAPMLTNLVKQGKLPELAKRLPPDPVVVQPLERVGVYGGRWRLTTQASGYGTGATQYQLCGYENLVRWDPTFKKIIGNVADSWEVAADGKEYTFKLHPGIKWSDGEPFTADDVVFAVDDVLNNTELTPVPDPYFGGATAEKIDDYTVKLSWDKPNGLLLTFLATRSGLPFTSNPKHYMTRFHKKYTPGVVELAKSESLDDWIALYQQRGGDFSFGSNPEKPSIHPWLLKTNTKNQVTVERNPYYWKVDPEGSQLPYMDGMVWSVVTDPQVVLLKGTNGEVDFAFDEPVNKPVLADGREKGGYRFFDAIPALTSQVAIYLNLAHKSKVLREVFNNKDLRIGLSHAINRTDIINAVMERQAVPWQIAPRKESTYYDEQMATQYLEYDVDRANEILDKAYPRRSPGGIRLGPDGKPISFQVDVRSDITVWADTMELVVHNWKDVGIDARVNSVSAELAVTRGEANSHDAAVWQGEGGLDAVILANPYNYLPTNPPYSFFGVPWCTWFRSGGKDGEEPPKVIRDQLDMYTQLRAEPDVDRQRQIMTQILASVRDQFIGIGIAAPIKSYGIISNRTQNFPKDNVMSHGTVWVYMDPAPTNPSQYFIEEQ